MPSSKFRNASNGRPTPTLLCASSAEPWPTVRPRVSLDKVALFCRMRSIILGTLLLIACVAGERLPVPGGVKPRLGASSGTALVAASASGSLRARQQLIVTTVGLSLFNDVLLLLMVVPMLPSLLETSTSGAGAHRELALALLFSTKEFCQCLCAPLAGALTVRVGTRTSLAASLIGLAVSTIAFAEARTYRQLVVARLLQGATSAALMSGGLTLIAETHEPERRAGAISRAHAGLGLGAALGPVVGGLGYEMLGRRATFHLVALLILLTAAAHIALHVSAPAGSVLREDRRRTRGAVPLVQQVRDLLRNWSVATVLAGMFAVYAAGGLFDTTYGLHLSDVFGLGPARASIIFSIEPITYLLTMATISWGGLIERVGKPRLAAAGLALVGLSLPLLTLGNRMESVVLALVLHGVGYGAKDAVGHGLLADLVDRYRLGSYAMVFALADSSDSAGYIVGPLAGTALSRAVGSPLVGLLFFAGLCGVLIAPTLELGEAKQRKR